MENELTEEEKVLLDDEERLRELGYRQELKRSLSSFSNFGLAFLALSIPASLLPFMYLGLETGGPRSMLITWPLVSICSVFVGLSMAEVVSAYPTSGGLYFWAAKLSSDKWAPMMSYYTGIFNFLGLLGLGAGTAYEFGSLFVALFYIPGILNVNDNPQSDLLYKLLALFFSFVGLFICGYLNCMSTRRMNFIGTLCLWINILGLAINVFGTYYIGDKPHMSLPELFKSWKNMTGFSDTYAFVISILPAAMTFTGYDCTAHLAEETKGASKAAPVAIMSSIFLALPLGFITLWTLLAPVPFSLYESLAHSPQTTSTVVDIFVYTQGPTFGFIQTFILIVTILTCPYALLATHARMSYAFARDGGLPYSSYLYYLDENKIPIRALYAVILLDAVLIIPSLVSSSLFSAINSIGTVGAYISYCIPIVLRIMKGNDFVHGPFSLGAYYLPCGIISIVWMSYACIALMLPTVNVVYDPVIYKSVSEFIWHFIDVFNWAPVMVIGVYIFSTAAWFMGVRDTFKGPKVDSSSEDVVIEEARRLLQDEEVKIN